jgi:hypothetical protein
VADHTLSDYAIGDLAVSFDVGGCRRTTAQTERIARAGSRDGSIARAFLSPTLIVPVLGTGPRDDLQALCSGVLLPRHRGLNLAHWVGAPVSAKGSCDTIASLGLLLWLPHLFACSPTHQAIC